WTASCLSQASGSTPPRAAKKRVSPKEVGCPRGGRVRDQAATRPAEARAGAGAGGPTDCRSRTSCVVKRSSSGQGWGSQPPHLLSPELPSPSADPQRAADPTACAVQSATPDPPPPLPAATRPGRRQARTTPTPLDCLQRPPSIHKLSHQQKAGCNSQQLHWARAGMTRRKPMLPPTVDGSSTTR